MSFLLWLLVVEDAFFLFAVVALLYLQDRMYRIVAIISFLIFLFVNVVMFRGNTNELLLILPVSSFTLLMLIARPFVSQKPRVILGIRATKALLLALSLVILLLITFSIVIIVKR